MLAGSSKLAVPVGLPEASANAMDIFGGLQVGKNNLIGTDADERA